MNLFFWRTNKQHDEFARNLAKQFIELYPLALKDKSIRKSDIKFKQAMNMLDKNAKDYRTKNRLGVYSKARIGNRFMWELREQGYDDAFSEDITNTLLLILK